MSPKLEKSEKMKGKKSNEAGNESTNLNNQLASVGKSLNRNCNSRRILRSSMRLVETEKSFLRGCLEPHLSSASSAPDGIQQRDVLAQTINSACQEIEIVETPKVGGGGGIEEEDEAECSPPSLSLKLSEMVAMGGHDDDDSETQSRPEDNDNPYQVKPEYMGILREIITKHGDIAKDCQAKSVKYRAMMLENICEVISALDNKDITNLKGVENMIDQIMDVKIMKVEVDWLLTRLTEILEARQAFKDGSKLKEKTDNISGFIEIAKSELKECEVEKKELSQKLKEICDREADWKVRLDRMQEESVTTAQKVKDVTSKVKRFLKCSLIDGLLY
ncbi:uncharacterized protein LOC127101677 isoform X1 [Lathyrus oleraceus]|nr:uncharacterized protein LOC127101677 isoform X1 [Pisum sativum]